MALSRLRIREIGAETTSISPGFDFMPEMVSIFLARGHGLGFSGSQTLSPIVGNRAVDNGPAIDAFPCVEDEKEIREPFQHHHPLALWAVH